MSFEHPRILWVTAVLAPLLALFLWTTWRKRQALIRQFVRNKALAQLSLGASPARQKWRRVLQACAATLLLLAVARPQWGFVWEEATQQGRDIVVAIDTSRSMLAEDLQPNRLVRAKLAALDLLKLGKYDRFGLVAFAGTAFLQCPLTFDEEAFRQSVQILEPGILPQGGTAIGAALDAARGAFGEDADDNHKVVVLFTDGEDHEEGVMRQVDQAAAAGVRIFTVGVGTPAGEVLRVRDDRGNLGFIKDESGNVVKSRLNEELLRKIATQANGFYLPLNAANSMEVLYQKGLAPLPTSERTTKLMKQSKDQFYWPLGLAIALLILEVLLPEQPRAPKRKPEARPALAAAAAALLLLIFAPDARATPGSAQRMYEHGEYKGALSEYQRLLGKSPEDPRLRFNAGAAAFKADKLEEALSLFQSAAGTPDLDLQQQAYYNLGNTQFRLGEGNGNAQERQASWEQAIQNYEAALRIDAADRDAAFNRDLVRQKLEQLKKEQQQQQQQQQQQKQDKKEKPEDNKDQKGQEGQDQKKDQQQNNQDNQQEQKKKESSGKDQDQSKEQQQQAQDRKPEEQKKGEQSQAQKQGGDKQSDEPQPESGEEGQTAQPGKMTPAQAKQLLDAQRDEEKALLFIPQERKSAPRDRVFKDW